ncbi:hypothetical protein [Halomicrobium salinisoli]|uniref:hypothetical protein n=1 Tax=Halomicrobium salinisoli TaxID=2878391 RepID=UPI001CF0006E|nr:hypothetical protein [Halomicrobium salinisoli]
MSPSPSVATADLVLLAVAAPMIVASLAAAVTSVQLGLALGAGSVPASGTIGYALFYDPPGTEQ